MNRFKNIATVAALLLSLSLPLAVEAQRGFRDNLPRFSAKGLSFSDPEVNWVDSVLNTLSLEQRIAQLMIVRVPLNMDDRQMLDFSRQMNSYRVGGVCFFAGTADRQAEITRRLRQDAAVPLLVSIDGEWGLGMRLKDMYSFPRNARFGLVEPNLDSLVYEMGVEVGRQCRMMGIHFNYAPVTDVNSNPKNPVIGTRAYSNDPGRVARLGSLFAKGQQSQGVMAFAKHFPGHGDTKVDSHLELPVINHSREHLDSVELLPFRRLVEDGVGGVMVGHLQVNAYDRERPSSLSPVIINGLLRNTLGFKGIVITDGIDMKGITNTYKDGTAELAALRAGNDFILLPPDVKQAIDVIASAAKQDEELRHLINYHCRRVLHTKYHYVLPTLGDEITVPGSDNRRVCQDIVADLNINLDRTIDSIVDDAISKHAIPGCQIVVMHRGKPILDRCYGHLTYDSAAANVTPTTLYDLASLTKVNATTLAVMKLADNGKVKIDDKLSRYLPYLKNTDKADITIKQAMSHCARLKAFDAYWKRGHDYDSILRLVAASPLNDKPGMLYSDLGFMLLSDLVKRVSGKPLDVFVREQFYQPMGLTNTTFRPMNHGVASKFIAPTEVDSLRGLICGEVHDPNAYAMGGVSGHAGLFSTAEEVALIMQMLLNGGSYNGKQYLSPETIALFTRRHFASDSNRRALGFDKQLFNPSKNGQVAPEASQNSFGHTGFTGTMCWVDPDYDLVYVFLSNRVHPSSSSNLLSQMNVRTQIQSVLYKYLNK